MMINNGDDKVSVIKITGRLDGVLYNAILTKREGEELVYSPNKKYIFSKGIKILEAELKSCVVSIREEDQVIVDAMECQSSYTDELDDEFKKNVDKMIEKNTELYGSNM